MIKREEKSFELVKEKLKLFISYLDISIQSLQNMYEYMHEYIFIIRYHKKV